MNDIDEIIYFSQKTIEWINNKTKIVKTKKSLTSKQISNINNLNKKLQWEFKQMNNFIKILLLVVLMTYECSKANDLHLAWDNPICSNDTNIVVELWHSTDLINWSIKDVVPSSQTNYITPFSYECEFFKIRNKDLTSGNVSVWSY